MQASLGPKTILIRGSRTHGSPCQTLQPGFAFPLFSFLSKSSKKGAWASDLNTCLGGRDVSAGIKPVLGSLWKGISSRDLPWELRWRGMAVSRRFGEPQDRPEAHPPIESETRPSVELGSWLLKRLLHLPTCTEDLVWVFYLYC